MQELLLIWPSSSTVSWHHHFKYIYIAKSTARLSEHTRWPALHHHLFFNDFSMCKSFQLLWALRPTPGTHSPPYATSPPTEPKNTLLIDSLPKRSHVPAERSEYRAPNESRWEFLQLLQTRLEEIASRRRIGGSILSHRDPHGTEARSKCKRQRGGGWWTGSVRWDEKGCELVEVHEASLGVCKLAAH